LISINTEADTSRLGDKDSGERRQSDNMASFWVIGHMNAVERLNHREALVAPPLDATLATIISPASLAA
jgi:hypothetical protein